MSLYISKGWGKKASTGIWIPGDPDQPNRADSKQELLSFAPSPQELPELPTSYGPTSAETN
jgi:hypothetical protein